METLATLDELERKFGENPRRYFAALANEYRKRGEFDRAIELCRTHLAEQQSHLSGYVVLGQALAELGDRRGAADAFRTALDLDPENFIALRKLGELALERREFDRARELFTQALDIEPRNEQLLAALASIEERVAPAAPPAAVATPATGVAAAGTAEAAIAAAEPVGEPLADEESADEESADEESADEDRAAVRGGLASETMADLYLSQGHRDAALEVLRQLTIARPGDERLGDRVRELEQPIPPLPPLPPPTVRDMFAQLRSKRVKVAQGRTSNPLAALFSVADEDTAADPLAEAFAGESAGDENPRDFASWLRGLGGT